MVNIFAIFTVNSLAQYYYIPEPTAGQNPKGLNTDLDYPPNSGGGVGWSTVLSGAGTSWSSSQTIPFGFELDGQHFTSFKVSPNGIVTFSTGVSNLPGNTPKALPSPEIPDNSLTMWGITMEDGDFVLTKTFGSAPNRQFWIQFNSCHSAGTKAGWVYTSIVLEETSNKVHFVDQRQLCGQNNNLCTGFGSITMGIQINATTAYQVIGSPVPLRSTNDFKPDDNGYYTFIPGVQPQNDINLVSLDIAEDLKLVDAPFLLKGKIKNYGADALTSFTLNYQVDGGQIVAHAISGISVPKLGEYSFTHSTPWKPTTEKTFDLKISVAQPNGSEDQDLSNNSVEKSINVWENLIDRRVLHEIFNSSTCGPCNPGNINYHDQIKNLDASEYVTLKYQQDFPGTGDPYATEETVARRGFYSINSIPRMEIDGQWDQIASQFTTAIHTEYRNKPTFVSLSGTFDRWDQEVVIEATYDAVRELQGNYTLYAAVLEGKTLQNIKSNGETEFTEVVKKVVPNQDGTKIGSISKKSPQTKSLGTVFFGEWRLPADGTSSNRINLDTEHSFEEFEDMMVALWIQNDQTKEVVQATYATEINSHVNDLENELNFIVYPNPTKSATKVGVKSKISGEGKIEIISAFGQLVYEEKILLNASIDNIWEINTSKFPAGLYYIKINVDNHQGLKTLVVR